MTQIARITAPAAPTPAATPDAPTGNVLIARIGVQADLTDEAQLPRGPERKAAVYRDLVETAQTRQVDALAKLGELQQAGDVTKVESLFLPNAILVTTTPGRHQAVSDALAGVATVSAVKENSAWSVASVAQEFAAGEQGAAAGAAYLAFARDMVARAGFREAAPDPAAPANADVEWGVDKIGAPEAWTKGIDGSGVTVGVIDTGLDSTHEAIRSHYRGTQTDGSQQHDYNWIDAIAGRDTPYDDDGHGTHVAGTSAGGTSDRAIGVAPGASIIAAKAINGRGYNTTDATLKALQFMLAPTRTDGSDADPTKGADVINNSWGQSVDQYDDTFEESFAALKAAGIELVTAAGNEGPREGTVSAPGAYPGYLSVAASTSSDAVARFSSRGPSKLATPEELVPNVTAPGSSIRSARAGGGYANSSGTSMASPHVAGAVALLLQAAPQASHDAIVGALTSTAVDIDRPGTDTASGFGRIDVARAIEQLTATTAPEAKAAS